MAQLEFYNIEHNQNGFAEFGTLENGGHGSGNFGHAGRKGKVGGSAPTGSGVGSSSEGGKSEKDKKKDDRKLKVAGAQSRIDELTSKIQSLGKPTTGKEYDQLEQMKKDLGEAKIDKLHYETGLDKEFLRDYQHDKDVVATFKEGRKNLQAQVERQEKAKDRMLDTGYSKKDADTFYRKAIEDSKQAVSRMDARIKQIEQRIKDTEDTIASKKKWADKN